ncbi:hypothetical protein GCM10010277_80110 [Streptomyces longisporoflavus]|nr:hypothetical protein GCM10010277_80110 [Streptomyces longisporoflavus]
MALPAGVAGSGVIGMAVSFRGEGPSGPVYQGVAEVRQVLLVGGEGGGAQHVFAQDGCVGA